MAGYKPQSPFNVSMLLLTPVYNKSNGVETKAYVEQGAETINGSFRTFGGTEKDINGLLTVEDTAVIETWYRPDINSNCRIKVLQTGAVYEILGTPENIQMRNQYLKFKVRGVKGGA